METEAPQNSSVGVSRPEGPLATTDFSIRDRPLVTVPASGHESGLVVIFHGAGDTAEGGFYDLAEQWAAALPHVKFLIPTAPVRGCMTAWMAINRKTKLLCSYENLWCEVLDLIETERVLHKVPLSRVVLLGLSAGALMASWVAMNLPSRCGGLVLLSGLSPCERLPEPRMAPGVEQTPVFYCEGAEDTQIPPSKVRASVDRLRKRGFTVDYHEIPGLGHTVSDEEADQVLRFLAGVLPEAAADAKEALQIGLSEDIKSLKSGRGLGKIMPRTPRSKTVQPRTPRGRSSSLHPSGQKGSTPARCARPVRSSSQASVRSDASAVAQGRWK